MVYQHVIIKNAQNGLSLLQMTLWVLFNGCCTSMNICEGVNISVYRIQSLTSVLFNFVFMKDFII